MMARLFTVRNPMEETGRAATYFRFRTIRVIELFPESGRLEGQ
jgi:hypothetical protein